MHRPPAISAGVDAAVPMTPRSGHPGLEVPDLYLGLSKPPAHQASAYTHRQSSHGGYAESDEAMATALQLLRSGDGGCLSAVTGLLQRTQRPSLAALLDRHAVPTAAWTRRAPTRRAPSAAATWPFPSSPFEQTTPPARDVALPLRSDSPEDMFGGPADVRTALLTRPTRAWTALMGSPLAGGSPL